MLYLLAAATGQPLRLILGPVSVGDAAPAGICAGHGHRCRRRRLVIAAGQQSLVLSSLQPAGKRMLPIADFLRGYPVHPGERFG